MAETFHINGRDFKAIANHSTARHDIWTQAQIMRAGLDRLAIAADESPDEFAMRVLREAELKGDVFLLLGGLVMPADKPEAAWTVEMAQDTADFLASVTEPADKAAIRVIIVSALTGFFVNGLSSLILSPSFSTKARSEQPATMATELRTTTGIGMSSSESSLGTIERQPSAS